MESRHVHYPNKIVHVYRGFSLVTELDENGKVISRDGLTKYPMPTDKMLFAPTFQIINLFDPMPFEPTLANDLSSFTQVFIHTLLAQRIADGVITPPELKMYRRMLEEDPLELRKNRDTQCSDARAIIAHHSDNGCSAAAARTGTRFGDMVSIMKFLWQVLQTNWAQGSNNRFPCYSTPYEGDPKKAAEEYDLYCGSFALLAEDYEDVRARILADSEGMVERILEKQRRQQAEREEAESLKRAAEGEKATVDTPELSVAHG